MHPTEGDAPLSQESLDFVDLCLKLSSEMLVHTTSLGDLALKAKYDHSPENLANLTDYMYIFQQLSQRVGSLNNVIAHVSTGPGQSDTVQQSIRDKWDQELGLPAGSKAIMSNELEQAWRRQHAHAVCSGNSCENAALLLAIMAACSR